jgi:hypothetical protein
MPKQPRTVPIADTFQRWEREGEEIERGLRERREQLVAELLIVDQSLERFEARRAARAPKKPRAARVAAESGGEAGRTDVAAELELLKPQWKVLTASTRQIVELRAAGKMPAAIGEIMKLPASAVASRVWNALGKLRAARQAGAAPAPAQTDDEADDPDGAKPAPTPIARVDQIRQAAERLKAEPAPDPMFVVGAAIVCRMDNGRERTGTIDAPGNRPDLFRVRFGSGKTHMVLREEILRLAAD